MKLFTPSEVAEMLSVNVDTVKRYSRNGELVGLQLGGRWRYQLTDIEAFIIRQKEISMQSITRKELPVIQKQSSLLENMPAVERLPKGVETDQEPAIKPADNIVVDIVMTEDPASSEINLIELILKLKSDGMKNNAIAEHLNSKGLKTKRGKPWTDDTVFNAIKKNK